MIDGITEEKRNEIIEKIDKEILYNEKYINDIVEGDDKKW